MGKPSKTPKVSAAKLAVPEQAAKAYAEVEPLLAKLSPDELSPITVDIPRAVAIAVGAVPHLAKLRDRAAKLPELDITSIDRLGVYAFAAWYAHLLALPEVVASTLGALVEEAKPLREDMLLAAELLAHKGFFDRKSVEAIRTGQGNLDTANDLVALAALFSAGWTQVENRTTVEWAEVERAAKLGPEILIAMGHRNQPGARVPDPASPVERRARAYTLFVRAYDECRRAVTYLRWAEDDVDDFTPSLFATRGPRRTGPDAEGAATDSAASPQATPPASPTDK